MSKKTHFVTREEYARKGEDAGLTPEQLATAYNCGAALGERPEGTVAAVYDPKEEFRDTAEAYWGVVSSNKSNEAVGVPPAGSCPTPGTRAFRNAAGYWREFRNRYESDEELAIWTYLTASEADGWEDGWYGGEYPTLADMRAALLPVESEPQPSPASDPKTVRVRIGIAVDEVGNWRVGRQYRKETEFEAGERIKAEHRFNESDPCRVSWIEAHVPLAAVDVTIKGVVKA